MRGEQDCLARGGDAPHEKQCLTLGGIVKECRRLVEKYHRCLLGKSLGYHDFLAFTI